MACNFNTCMYLYIFVNVFDWAMSVERRTVNPEITIQRHISFAVYPKLHFVQLIQLINIDGSMPLSDNRYYFCWRHVKWLVIDRRYRSYLVLENASNQVYLRTLTTPVYMFVQLSKDVIGDNCTLKDKIDILYNYTISYQEMKYVKKFR